MCAGIRLHPTFPLRSIAVNRPHQAVLTSPWPGSQDVCHLTPNSYHSSIHGEVQSGDGSPRSNLRQLQSSCGVHGQRDYPPAGLPPFAPPAFQSPTSLNPSLFGLRIAAHHHRHHSSINLRPYPFAKPRTRILSPFARRPLDLFAARFQRKGRSALLRLCWFRLFPLE